MSKDENTWKLRASTPFIYESEENVAQKFIHGGRSRISKFVPKTPKPTKVMKKTDNISNLKSHTFAPTDKIKKPPQMSTFKSKTCNFDAEMAASPVAISHKYYEYITDANAKFNVNGMGVFRKFKPDVPTITCKPQVFDWNLNLQQNILHKPKNSSADLRYNAKSKLKSSPPPPTPIFQSTRKDSHKVTPIRTSYVNKLDDNLSPSTLGLIRKIIRKCSKHDLSKSNNKGYMNTDSDSTLDGIYLNISNNSRMKQKNLKKVPKTQKNIKDNKHSTVKRIKSVIKVSSNDKAMIKKRSSAKNALTSQRDSTKSKQSKATKTTVARKHPTKDVKKEKEKQ